MNTRSSHLVKSAPAATITRPMSSGSVLPRRSVGRSRTARASAFPHRGRSEDVPASSDDVDGLIEGR